MNKLITYEHLKKIINNVVQETTIELINILTNELNIKIENLLTNKIIDILTNINDIDKNIDSSDNTLNNDLIDNTLNNELIDNTLNNTLNNNLIDDTLNNNLFDDTLNNNLIDDTLNNDLIDDTLNNDLNDNTLNNDLIDDTLNNDLNDNIIKVKSSNNITDVTLLNKLNNNSFNGIDNVNNVMDNELSDKLATIVTCYYIIPNKYNNKNYNEWIENFMLLNANKIIYCDKNSHQFLSLNYPEKDNLKYIIKEMNDFYVNKWDWKKEEEIDFEIIRGHNEFLYKIWAEKIFFIQDAINRNIFKNDIYCWTDIGSFRQKNKMNDFTDFPNKKYIVREKINMFLINKFKDDETKNIHIIDDRFKFVDRLSGIFAGGIQILLDMAKLYEQMLYNFDKMHIFKGKDQTIWNYIYINNINLFYINESQQINGYDKWFYFHYKWSSNTIKQKDLLIFNIGDKYKIYHDLQKYNILNRINRSFIKNGKYDFYIINLYNRKDRYNHILNIFNNYDFNLYFIDGFEEIVGRIGCNKSHLYAINYAKNNNMPYIIVLEDDFIFNDDITKDEFNNILYILTTNSNKYDIFNGSPTFWDQRNSLYNVKKYKSFNDDFHFITHGQKATFVIYTYNMYDKMINEFNPNTDLYNDQYIAHNFKQLCYKKYLCYELNNYSNIVQKQVDNTPFIKSQEEFYKNMIVNDLII